MCAGQVYFRRGAAEVFFPLLLPTFYKYEQKCGVLEKKDTNCHVFSNSRWAILPSSYFLTASFHEYFISSHLAKSNICPAGIGFILGIFPTASNGI
jgi:hypothetical protein